MSEVAPLVYKFGGAVLRLPEGFAAMVQRLREGLRQGQPLLLIVSALGRVTRQLEQAAFTAEAGRGAEALAMAAQVLEHHRELAAQLLGSKCLGFQEYLEGGAQKLEGYLQGIAVTGELTPRALDAVRSFGEMWASALVAAFLRGSGIDPVCIDAPELIQTDSQHGAAQPLLEPTRAAVHRHLMPLLQPGRVVLTQGFIGRSVEGRLTTMGQESSALTAVLLAALTGAEEVTFWTDVAGIRECNPALVAEATLVPQMSYTQALQVAKAGLRLLHPRMVEFASQSKLRLRFRSAFAPEDGETVVSELPGRMVPMIVVRERVYLLALPPEQMSTELRLHAIDGSSLFLRWDEPERTVVLRSSDVPYSTPREVGGLVTVLYGTQRQIARLIQLCGQQQHEGAPVRLWSLGDQLRCFVSEDCLPSLVRALWRELRASASECTKGAEAAS
ncbi:MAG: hypothetical protein ABDH31_03230 [Chlorobiota bacterium]